MGTIPLIFLIVGLAGAVLLLPFVLLGLVLATSPPDGME